MKNGVFSEYKIFAGNSNHELAEEIAAIMGKPLGKSTVSKFSDGEISVSLWESVRGEDVYIICLLYTSWKARKIFPYYPQWKDFPVYSCWDMCLLRDPDRRGRCICDGCNLSGLKYLLR